MQIFPGHQRASHLMKQRRHANSKIIHVKADTARSSMQPHGEYDYTLAISVNYVCKLCSNVNAIRLNSITTLLQDHNRDQVTIEGVTRRMEPQSHNNEDDLLKRSSVN